VPLHFTAFHPDWKMLDRPPTPPATLRRARDIAHSHGLRYVYTGNVRDPEGARTRCHACGATLVARDGYAIAAWHLGGDGRCRSCGTPCDGVFDGPPGTWGARRLPVQL
jgi:pyruvate formate lyase activating enzyme